MATIDVHDMDKKIVGEMTLDENVFKAAVKQHLIYESVKFHLANRRAGTVAVKNRASVAGSGKKPFRQKGTGQARQGCIRAPQYPGGGVAFGPKQKDYNYSLNKKAKKAALKSVLSQFFRDNKITVINSIAMEQISTKRFVDVFSAFNLPKFLLVLDTDDVNVKLSARNVKHVKVTHPEGLNTYEILNYKHIIFTEAAVKRVEGALQQ
jgi:large subunit ribosomal protein L4